APPRSDGTLHESDAGTSAHRLTCDETSTQTATQLLQSERGRNAQEGRPWDRNHDSGPGEDNPKAASHAKRPEDRTNLSFPRGKSESCESLGAVVPNPPTQS